MTERPDEERRLQEEEAEEESTQENPVEELLEGLERFGWRPANTLWGDTEQRRIETEKRREELINAWRRRRIRPSPGHKDNALEDERVPENDEEDKGAEDDA